MPINLLLLKHVYTALVCLMIKAHLKPQPSLPEKKTTKLMVFMTSSFLNQGILASTGDIKSRICHAYILILCNSWMMELGFGSFSAVSTRKKYCARMVQCLDLKNSVIKTVIVQMSASLLLRLASVNKFTREKCSHITSFVWSDSLLWF